MTITGTAIRALSRMRALSIAACPLSLTLKIAYQVFHANPTGQKSCSFVFHRGDSAFTGVIDPHDSLEIHDKITLGMSVTGFLPVGAKARNPRVSEPSLENEPLLGVSVDSRNLQHRSPFHRSQSLFATQITRSNDLRLPRNCEVGAVIKVLLNMLSQISLTFPRIYHFASECQAMRSVASSAGVRVGAWCLTRHDGLVAVSCQFLLCLLGI